MANNKIVYNGTTLIDLTGDDVKASDVREGVLFHLPSGVQAEGTASGGGGDKTMILDVSCYEPSDYTDEQEATVTGYDYISDILDAMPNVVARWDRGSYDYVLLTPTNYTYSGQSDIIHFECSLNGPRYMLDYNPGYDVWYMNLINPDQYLPYEDWEFEVDDGEGGTMTVTKRIFCIDISE